MNEKLNTVFDIINATNTVSANRYLSHALGAEVAIIYNALLAKYAYYSKHDMIPDDWFYSTIDDLWRSTALSEKTQKRAIAILVKEGLIECKRKGMPAKRSFFICNAYEKIVALIEKGKEILGETTAETAKSKAIEGDSAVQPKRQNKNSRKSEQVTPFRQNILIIKQKKIIRSYINISKRRLLMLCRQLWTKALTITANTRHREKYRKLSAVLMRTVCSISQIAVKSTGAR